LQAEASACVSGLANVQFCAWAVHYFVFLFLSLSSKLYVRFGLLHLAVTVGASGVRDFEKHHCQAATEPSRLFIKHIFLYKNPSKTDWRKLNRAKTLKNYARPHYICTLLPPGFYSSSVC
jgi:hypothetical protein